ncbi:MAG: class I SAM-dependent methyltransferase [Rubrivivax sp.]|nr:class I SAM-dependent methyltransferase [Rubrivivax sp.]
MTRDESSIELDAWLQTAPGRYLLGWEQARIDREVADIFGFHALQLGLPELDGLRANRMPHRWVATDSLRLSPVLPLPPRVASEPAATTAGASAPALHCEFDALPLPDASIDLVVLPHSLELARDPHQTLREVERVLVPDGRVVVVGFNPTSLWGLRQRLGGARRSIGLGRGRGLFLPAAGDFIGYWRARDWLRLLGFEVEGGRFGCWRPPLASERWLQRFAWMDRIGDRWWPVLGAVYMICAVKRVRGMRLVGLARHDWRTRPRAAAAAVARRHGSTAPVVRERSDA